MSEEGMIELTQAALRHHGIEDTVIAAGQLKPRGSSGTSLVGGLVGGELGGGLGLGAGMVAGTRVNATTTALPPMVIVAVSETKVYGLHSKSRRREPDTVLFALPREGLRAVVHQRMEVRVLELIHEETGSSVQLEGSRLPITHSKDVMDVLTGAAEEH